MHIRIWNIGNMKIIMLTSGHKEHILIHDQWQIQGFANALPPP